MNNKGFTLIEVVLVIAILGILASILVPSFKRYQMNARVTAHNTTVNTLKAAGFMYATENPEEIEAIEIENLKHYIDDESDWKLDAMVGKAVGNQEFVISIENGEVKVSPGLVEINDGKIQLKNKDS